MKLNDPAREVKLAAALDRVEDALKDDPEATAAFEYILADAALVMERAENLLRTIAGKEKTGW